MFRCSFFFQVQKPILPNTPNFPTSIIIEMVDLGIQCMSSNWKVTNSLVAFVIFRLFQYLTVVLKVAVIHFCLCLVFSWDIIKLITWRHTAVCGVFPWTLQESQNPVVWRRGGGCPTCLKAIINLKRVEGSREKVENSSKCVFVLIWMNNLRSR